MAQKVDASRFTPDGVTAGATKTYSNIEIGTLIVICRDSIGVKSFFCVDPSGTLCKIYGTGDSSITVTKSSGNLTVTNGASGGIQVTIIRVQ